MIDMTNPRLRQRSELIEVFCDSPSQVKHAMEGDGRWTVKLPGTGHTIVFNLEGEYLVAKATPEQAQIMREMSIFEVDGEPRKVDPMHTVKNWFAEGERLAQEKQGKGSKGGLDDITSIFKSLGLGDGFLADRMAAMMSERIEAEARARVEQRAAEDAARRAEHSGEFGFVRLSERLLDDQVIMLMNTYLPERDPASFPAAARVTLLSKAAAVDLGLQAALRELLGALEE